MTRIKWFKHILRRGGTKLLYSALLLYYAFRRKDLPTWARSIMVGALGYLLSPMDAIPDLTPILGFTDDFGLLSYALVLVAAYIDTDVRQKARTKLNKVLGYEADDQLIRTVEEVL